MYLTLLTALAAEAPPIVGGERTGDYPAVLLLWTGDATCTGTLVAPNWLVTAAHCVKGGDPDKMSVHVGKRPFAGSEEASSDVTELFAHPDYRSNMSKGMDVGLVHLATPLESVVPMPLTRATIDNSWEGRDVRYVGYGVTSETANDSGVKRTVVVPFYQLDEHWMYTYDPGHNMCWGDSGGPAFVEEDGELAVAGIISWVGSWDEEDRPCSTGWGSSTRIDTVRDWIDGYVTVRYAEDTGSAEPWDTAPPPQDSDPVVEPKGPPDDKGGICGTLPGAGSAMLGLLLLAGARRRRG